MNMPSRLIASLAVFASSSFAAHAQRRPEPPAPLHVAHSVPERYEIAQQEVLERLRNPQPVIIQQPAVQVVQVASAVDRHQGHRRGYRPPPPPVVVVQQPVPVVCAAPAPVVCAPAPPVYVAPAPVVCAPARPVYHSYSSFSYGSHSGYHGQYSSSSGYGCNSSGFSVSIGIGGGSYHGHHGHMGHPGYRGHGGYHGGRGHHGYRGRGCR